ncbi:MAG: GDP-mannose mannosyl hydrolase [Aquificae bacterium]|nr:GDP-mannose mannosyl hydrolase [Aquificota bacterium]
MEKTQSKRRWIEPEIFHCIIKHTPLVSIDIIIRNKEGKYLLGLRKNRPAKGFWFVPGGRIFKGETIEEAFRNITRNELGIEFNKSDAKFLGVFEHFYDDNFFGEDTGTHYIVNAFLLEIGDVELKPDIQHEAFRWATREEILSDNKVHEYCKDYFRKNLHY